MKWSTRDLMYRLTATMEILIGFLLIAALLSACFGLLRDFAPAQLIESPKEFSVLLSAAATLVLGIEFIRMLCTHTLDSVLEIMLLAIARQMIVEHTTPLENMISVVSMALLYMVRKYLYIPKLDYVKPVPTIAQILFGKKKAGQEDEDEDENEREGENRSRSE